jgi:hypothetical protein
VSGDEADEEPVEQTGRLLKEGADAIRSERSPAGDHGHSD